MSLKGMQIGELPDSSEIQPGYRDAVHVGAIAGKVPYPTMLPGDKVRFSFKEGHWEPADPTDHDSYHGIIDPFLPPGFITSESMVWILLRPNIVKRLRHTFSIHGVPDEPEVCDDFEAYDDECRGCY